MTTLQMLVYIFKSMFVVTLLTALVLVVLAAIDYAYQRYQHERDLRMTPQQVREELKRAEGDPLVKARVRQIQRDLARRRMMHDVPRADVVVRNPTRFAVALRYDAKTMKAPKVVAKGMNLIAEHIIELAKQHRVPTVENRPLARALHKMVEVGDEIPVTLYRAVAEVLAYVYQLRKRPVSA
jgi:flagellar biosynthetic protein FlhB